MHQDDTSAGVFGAQTEAWAQWQSTPWGRLRYRVAEHTTARALAALPGVLRILDVGGGDGGDALPLAGQGHHVTILDYSEPLLVLAAESAAAAGLSDRIRTVCADLDDLPDFPNRFDAVLCHNALQYSTDLNASLALLISAVRPGGIVSVMAPNPAMDVLSAAVRRTDPKAAADVLDALTVRSATFDHDMRRLEPDSVETALREQGCRIQHRFGIRCVMDLIADDELKANPAFYAEIERLELLVCEREPYWRLARFWQLTAVLEP